eukprot:7684291-Pyramimonas_sp.AAC.1
MPLESPLAFGLPNAAPVLNLIANLADALRMLCAARPRPGQQRSRQGLVEAQVLDGGLGGLHDSDSLREGLVSDDALM